MTAVFTKRVIIYSLLIAAVYLILVAYLMNYRFVIETVFGNYPISYKGKILVGLLEGLNSNMTPFSLALLAITALLLALPVLHHQL